MIFFFNTYIYRDLKHTQVIKNIYFYKVTIFAYSKYILQCTYLSHTNLRKV